MVGSTNHLDRLDPGIAKRPSRFDRKYPFPNPDMAQRIAYMQFWQRKLMDSEVAFPDEICPAVAKITKDFSFAYLQEAIMSALLAIARKKTRIVGDTSTEVPDLDQYVLWREIRKQVALLREQLDQNGSGSETEGSSACLNHPLQAAFAFCCVADRRQEGVR